MKERYCIDLANYEKFPSKVVNIGDIPVGGKNPVRLQSMTNTDTLDLKSTTDQAKKIFDAGADFVRITTPGIKEANFLKDIKESLYKDAYKKPLIADVHFNPQAAEIAAEIVEKIRINPGNYVDPRASFNKENISDAEYKEELERMHKRLLPLIKICKKNGTAIRIGSNYGSLSDRIMNKYGNTPEGMVEAAMEFYRIFKAENFRDLILSMKASDTRVMVEASRLLNARMIKEGEIFPQHLGVTEAGEGKEGRLRSAVGIGALLADGIGDTIRVSLTEAPEKEISFAKMIAEHFALKKTGVVRMPLHFPEHDTFETVDNSLYPLLFEKFVVITDFRDCEKLGKRQLRDMKFKFSDNKWKPSKNSPDGIILNKDALPENKIETEIISTPGFNNEMDIRPIYKSNEQGKMSKGAVIETSCDDFDEVSLKEIINKYNPVFLLKTFTDHPAGEFRSFLSRLGTNITRSPVLVKLNIFQDFALTAAEYGAILSEGRAAGVVFTADNEKLNYVNENIFDMLQSAGLRRTKAEFISCPGCGRTKFNLEKTTSDIKRKFGHLDDIKIAVMGCIVNGPGEMLDADYGYVGAGKGKITLYKGEKAVMKNIPEQEAIEALKTLLKRNNHWKDPQ